MASWEILAKLGIVTSQFEAGLKKASKESKEFSKAVKEHAGEARDAIKDIAKETGAGKLANLLGFAGGAASVTAFGAAIVEAVKEGVGAFGQFETSALHLGTVFGNIKLGDEIEEWIHQLPAAAGKIEDLEIAMKALGNAGLNDTAAKNLLIPMAKIAAGQGANVADYAIGFQRAENGGLDIGEGASKMLKNNPYLSNLIRGDMTTQANRLGMDLIHRHGMSPEDRAAEEARLEEMRTMSPAEYVKKGNLNFDTFVGMINKAAGPHGQYGNIFNEIEQTGPGKQEQAQKELHDNFVELGRAMSGEFKPAMDALIEEMPKLKPIFHELGEEMGNFIHKALPEITRDLEMLYGQDSGKPKGILGQIDQATQGADSWLMNAAQGFLDIQNKIDADKPGNQSPEAQARLHKAVEDQTALLRQIFMGS